ncbi:hypothetical protein JQX13_30440 [Archangium violaceum]|uniref:OmpH family outer membrane protein n=1 Tax=Archangium violaceum TaxID=83451 RepID=UPI00193BE166|nr:OmpH family outer membrane protein [Archangium violaceum]QRK04559.1 hypothetical protein JQX13_30440 [Archangium violaceum]
MLALETSNQGLFGSRVPVRPPVDTFPGMNGWLTLSLSLLLGQTTPTSAAPTEAAAERAVQEAELNELRAELELLQAQMEAQRQETQGRIQSLEQEQALEDARAEELELLRREQLESLSRGYDWLITVDQLLEVGDFDIGPAVTSALREISSARATAAERGSGDTVLLIESALNRLATIDDLVGQRNIYPARRQLETAGFELRRAWQLGLERSGTTLVNQ